MCVCICIYAKVSEFSRKCACATWRPRYIYLLDVTTHLATVSAACFISTTPIHVFRKAECVFRAIDLERDTCGIEIRIGTAVVFPFDNVTTFTSPSTKIYFIVIVPGSILKVSVKQASTFERSNVIVRRAATYFLVPPVTLYLTNYDNAANEQENGARLCFGKCAHAANANTAK